MKQRVIKFPKYRRHASGFNDLHKYSTYDKRDQYVAQFDKNNCLKPTRIEWVKVDYCFG